MNLKKLLCAALAGDFNDEMTTVPEAGIPIWNAFVELSGTRSWNAHGPNPIAFAEIAAWCRLMQQPFEPHHIQCLVAMDRVWIAQVQANLGKGKATPNALPAAQGPLTAKLFDAVVG